MEAIHKIVALLDRHAGAVQAIAGIASLMLTAALAVITAVYVRFTWDLVKAARSQAAAATAQLHEAQRKRIARRDRLHSLIQGLLRLVRDLPTERQHADEQIRRVDIWTDTAVEDLSNLGVEFDLNAKLGVVVPGLRWLSARVREVQAVRPEAGYDWRKFPWNDYESTLRTTHEMLRSMFTDVDTTPTDDPPYDHASRG
jgi:hypothetical protein